MGGGFGWSFHQHHSSLAAFVSVLFHRQPHATVLAFPQSTEQQVGGARFGGSGGGGGGGQTAAFN